MKLTQSFVNKEPCNILATSLGATTELTTKNRLLRTQICMTLLHHVLRLGLLCEIYIFKFIDIFTNISPRLDSPDAWCRSVAEQPLLGQRRLLLSGGESLSTRCLEADWCYQAGPTGGRSNPPPRPGHLVPWSLSARCLEADWCCQAGPTGGRSNPPQARSSGTLVLVCSMS